MAEFTVELPHGITVSGASYKTAVLRDATVQDILEGTAAAEKVVSVPAGVDKSGGIVYEPRLVVSDFECGINILCRQIVSVGPLEGPFERAMLNKLSPADLNTLQQAIMQREQVQAKELIERGRSESA